MNSINQTPYEAIGGEATLKQLVETFYNHVQQDDRLAPLFTGNFDDIKQKQFQFLTQFLGGPTLYSDEYGHPMLRARHMPFPITIHHAEAWLHCMNRAMDDVKIPGLLKEFLMQRLQLTAMHMVNTEVSKHD